MRRDIERVKVSSSAFAEVGHDGEAILELKFHPRKDGWSAVWHYSPVSADTYNQILAAESAGAAFHQLVRSNPDVSSLSDQRRAARGVASARGGCAMSLFKDSGQITDADVFDKILFWGPNGVGKTHTAMTWPDPVFVDREGGRAAHFRDRFHFMHFAPTSLSDVAAAFKELRAPSAPGKTVVTDSASAIYADLVVEHTSRTENGKYVTDWVTVNRRFGACLDFAFGVTAKNVIFTAHQATKLVRQGRDFRADGLKFIGDEKFRYAFDYIFRLESKGDPRVAPPIFHVEKSAAPDLKVGQQIQGLDYARFIALTRQKKAEPPPLKGEQLADAQARGDVPTRGELLARTIAKIGELVAQYAIAQTQIAAVVKYVTRGKQTDYTTITMLEEAEEIVARIVRLKEKRAS